MAPFNLQMPLMALASLLLSGQDSPPPAQNSLPMPVEDLAPIAIQAVQNARLEVRGKPGRSGKTVKQSVAWFERLYPKNSPDSFRSIGWSAKPTRGGRWVVTLKLYAQGTKTEAQWEYDPKSGAVGYMDHLSKHLSWVP